MPEEIKKNEEEKTEEPAVVLEEIEVEDEEAKKAPVAQLKSKGRRGFGAPSGGGGGRRRGRDDRKNAEKSEYEQKIVDIARVTRVMAGGKRMRFRACVVLGNRNGKVGVGLAKAADVTNAITKAVEQAKKNMLLMQIVNGTIVHEVRHKFGAARILLKPSKQGTGIIAGGAARIVLELAGIKNIVGKILGTSNSVNNVKCVMEALRSLKYVEPKAKKIKPGEPRINNQPADKAEVKNI
ncbi:30S ribosomal protein S5 [Candidatus Falkowbacteria bacterium CG10_big_fil_rev_8_21_14_0_10_43_11]|uniref:Small ribosomal subunit protein uS5 n=1 Tax=Candidatus Falkowbacteria bacterium CG10_big_fil_rev_8_21_14_0_10_43_11 TaxID=1974568 RepID=A0A2M6WLS8_9BACT|nr:MAG: 30S ribosomal protein S5 [Candidatus Falkowbacteria bacterium CG10_big_fil_rev_8_21_14_0_10_43_11]